MGATPNQAPPSSGAIDYLKARHGDPAGWAADGAAALASMLPGFIGMGLRSAMDRLVVKGKGLFARERRTRLLGTRHMAIGRGCYLDEGVYLHGRPGGLTIGAGTRIMRNAVVHVYNFRDLPGSGVAIGQGCVIGMNCVVTGQGGVEIGDGAIMGPGSMALPVNHVYGSADQAVREQGIEGSGIKIGAGAWIGAGAIVLDGVTIGERAVVGAGSVVTRDVAADEVVAGNPARPVEKKEQAE